jgi:hypothetical protein
MINVLCKVFKKERITLNDAIYALIFSILLCGIFFMAGISVYSAYFGVHKELLNITPLMVPIYILCGVIFVVMFIVILILIAIVLTGIWIALEYAAKLCTRIYNKIHNVFDHVVIAECPMYKNNGDNDAEKNDAD